MATNGWTKPAIAAAAARLAPALTFSAPADPPNPYLQPDESWIRIRGTVVDPGPESFTLDYGKGTVTVEMEDWEWYHEGYQMIEGDPATVYGRIDDDLF